MKKAFLFLIGLIVVFIACDNEPEYDGEKSVQEVREEGAISNADKIRNPITVDDLSPDEIAKFEFESKEYDFGEVEDGQLVYHEYKFKNSGVAPLVINNAKGSCGCTVPDYPKEPIAPGDSAVIKVKFNTEGRPKNQYKEVTIEANTTPKRTKLKLTGFVKPKN